jgi:glyoxylase-like metal-dependent hydrolase (beta-lactamase superfamily II)
MPRRCSRLVYHHPVDVRIISIGTLAAHPLRGERTPVRTGHSTTTLIQTDRKKILVDPGLPAAAVVARLEERAGLRPADITHVFLTSFNPELRRGLLAFEHATWWISSLEREQIGAAMVARLQEAAEEGDQSLRETLELEVAILRRCESAPDTLGGERGGSGGKIDLFPLPGMTPGLCGLLVSTPRLGILICGDAVATVEHLEQGKVLSGAADVDKARESFSEAIEVAELLIPGRDNIAVNPTKRPF